MIETEIRKIVIEYLKKHKANIIIFNKHHPKLTNQIFSITNYLDETASFSERLYIISHNIEKQPLCYCGNKVKFISRSDGYRTFCSVKCTSNDKEIKSKRNETNIKRYGSICPLNNKKIKQKSIDTLQKHYGNITNPGELRLANKKLRKIAYESYIIDKNIIDNFDILFTEEEYINNGPKNKKLKFKCKKCNNIFETYLYNGHKPRCYTCDPRPLKSIQEEEIIKYIRSKYNGIIKRSNRSILSNIELDILLPEKNIAFEYNGLYWHSNIFKDDNYHLDKTIKCNEKNIQLIHIFEDEWLNKKQIVKNRIDNILQLTKYKIYARKCIVKEIDNKTKNVFLEKYHIQGKDNSKIKLGLFHKNRLVSVMTFGKPRFNKKYDWELIRYCNIGKFNIVGGAGKLLKYFEINNKGSIITYADRRWSKGNLYEKIGFERKGISPKNFYYVWRNKRESRMKYQKHKLKNILEKFDENKTEYENMKENGFSKIYDCGNFTYVKER